MFIFARRRRINPAKGSAALALSIEAANRANKITGIETSVWTPVLSPEVGMITWSARAERLDELEAALDKLAASGDFTKWVEGNDSHFQGPIEDSVLQVIHGNPAPKAPAYVQLAQAVCAHGAMGDAMSFGVEIAELGTRLTGLQTMFGAGLTGPYGSVSWISGAPDLSTLEAATAKLAADAEWSKLIDRGGHAFQPGVTSMFLRRLN